MTIKLVTYDTSIPSAVMVIIKSDPRLNDVQFVKLSEQPDLENVAIHLSKFPLPLEHLRAMRNLKLFQIAKAGYEEFDFSWFKPKCIICNNAGANAQSVSEHTLFLTLAVLRHGWHHHSTVLNKGWKNLKNRNEELANKSALIIGFGNIGKKVAVNLRALGVHVTICDVDPEKREQANKLNFNITNLYETDLKYDLISLHIPCYPADQQSINKAFFDRYCDRTVLINTARGKLLDMRDLIDAIKNNQIRGVGLDVFPDEPFHDIETFVKSVDDVKTSDFLGLCFAPHAGPSFQTNEKLAQNIIHNIIQTFGEKRHRGVLDRF